MPYKNLRRFAGTTLLHIKLNQLFNLDLLKQVIVSTDDQAIIDSCSAIDDSRLVIHRRDPELCRNDTTTDELVRYFAEVLEYDHLLWTHVTSPFADTELYRRAIKKYEDGYGANLDSLVGVEKVQEFVWRRDFSPVNYSFESDGIWPRTQTIEPVYIVNSALFLIPHEIMLREKNRVGVKPEYFEMDHLESFDIDWKADFDIAEKLWEAVT